jgi:hypothetical protein
VFSVMFRVFIELSEPSTVSDIEDPGLMLSPARMRTRCMEVCTNSSTLQAYNISMWADQGQTSW